MTDLIEYGKIDDKIVCEYAGSEFLNLLNKMVPYGRYIIAILEHNNTGSNRTPVTLLVDNYGLDYIIYRQIGRKFVEHNQNKNTLTYPIPNIFIDFINIIKPNNSLFEDFLKFQDNLIKINKLVKSYNDIQSIYHEKQSKLIQDISNKNIEEFQLIEDISNKLNEQLEVNQELSNKLNEQVELNKTLSNKSTETELIQKISCIKSTDQLKSIQEISSKLDEQMKVNKELSSKLDEQSELNKTLCKRLFEIKEKNIIPK